MFDKLFKQFGPMLGLLNGQQNPDAMLGIMGMTKSPFAKALKEAQEFCKGKNPEQVCREQFQQNGIDVDQLRRQYGI